MVFKALINQWSNVCPPKQSQKSLRLKFVTIWSGKFKQYLCTPLIQSCNIKNTYLFLQVQIVMENISSYSPQDTAEDFFGLSRCKPKNEASRYYVTVLRPNTWQKYIWPLSETSKWWLLNDAIITGVRQVKCTSCKIPEFRSHTQAWKNGAVENQDTSCMYRVL